MDAIKQFHSDMIRQQNRLSVAKRIRDSSDETFLIAGENKESCENCDKDLITDGGAYIEEDFGLGYFNGYKMEGRCINCLHNQVLEYGLVVVMERMIHMDFKNYIPKKVTGIQAFQLTDDYCFAFNEKIVKLPSSIEVKTHHKNPVEKTAELELCVDVGNGFVKYAGNGDYIIKDAYGSFDVMDPESFKNAYQESE